MKNIRLLLVSIFSTCLLLAGCSDEASVTSQKQESDSELTEMILDDLAPSETELRELLEKSKTKKKYSNGIAHYRFDVRLGSGPFDVVRIHRVVKERPSHRPVRTRGSVFMVHGSGQTFSNIFLNAGTENPDPQTSSPMYLASQGIDVWGIDLAWNFIPEETTDFSFLKGWGVMKDAKHTLASMSIARFLRGLTGQGFGRMNLLGFSYGAGVAYVAAGSETRQHWRYRDIRGIIPVDFSLKLDNEKWRQSACVNAENNRNDYENNQAYFNSNAFIVSLGEAALNAPNETSTLLPVPFPLTNYQAPLFIAMNPRPVTGWHFLAGNMDIKNGIYEPYHTAPKRWFKLLSSVPAGMPKLPGIELAEARCGEKEVSIDDHLEDITLPIYYLGSTGAEGEEGYYTTTLTSSSDITTHTVSGSEPGKEDYGHADLFMAENAPGLVWDGIKEWIVKHERSRRDFGGGRK